MRCAQQGLGRSLQEAIQSAAVVAWLDITGLQQDLLVPRVVSAHTKVRPESEGVRHVWQEHTAMYLHQEIV